MQQQRAAARQSRSADGDRAGVPLQGLTHGQASPTTFSSRRISELTTKLRAKEFSAVELTRAFCDRLERMGPRYNALALSLREQAVRKAKDVDGDMKREPLCAASARHSVRRQGSARGEGASDHLGREAVRRPGVR